MHFFQDSWLLPKSGIADEPSAFFNFPKNLRLPGGGKVNFFSTIKGYLTHVKTYQPGKPIEEVQREYGVRDAIKMASNENALGPSPMAVAAMRANLLKVHRYPDGGCYYLREKLSKHLKVNPEMLVFGNGSDEILVFVVRAFVGKADEVIIADPTFLIYEIATQVEDGVVVKVPMKNFAYDLEGMKKKISPRTRLIFIANPDNPVGTYVSAKRLNWFLNLVPKDVIVVVDEAYYEFARPQKDYPDTLSLLRAHKNLIVTRTFSKAYGLSGLRVGYAIADPSVTAALNKVREPFNVNLLAQVGAAAALDDKAHLKKTVEMTNEGRQYLTEQLTELGCQVVETATNFILADLKMDAAKVNEKLLRRGVIVRPMAVWGLPSFIRVTIGRSRENRFFIRQIKQVFKECDITHGCEENRRKS